jgi:hypothetical protein
MPPNDLSRFCCQDPGCTLYGVRDAGHLSVRGLFGKQKHIRLLDGSACKARFSERKGTAFFRSGLAPEVALSVLPHLVEGNGIRPTARLTGVHRDTVTRLARLAGRHAHDAPDELVAFSPRDA